MTFCAWREGATASGLTVMGFHVPGIVTVEPKETVALVARSWLAS